MEVPPVGLELHGVSNRDSANTELGHAYLQLVVIWTELLLTYFPKLFVIYVPVLNDLR